MTWALARFGWPKSPRGHDAPVFIGGTGRSGTTIVGDLLGRTARYALVPVEIRLHTDPGGFPDLFAPLERPSLGRRGPYEQRLETFRDKVLGRWFKRPNRGGTPRGLQVIVGHDRLVSLLDLFERQFPLQRYRAAGRLMSGLLDPVASRAGKPAWVEMTPATANATALLSKLYPGARFIHCVRDGRDVACSIASRAWGPDTAGEALLYWANRLRDAEAQARMIPGGRILVIRLEHLVLSHREELYNMLCDFLDLHHDQGGMREFFDRVMSPSRAHIGRWRQNMDALAQQEFDRRYQELVAELRADGVRFVLDYDDDMV